MNKVFTGKFQITLKFKMYLENFQKVYFFTYLYYLTYLLIFFTNYKNQNLFFHQFVINIFQKIIIY